MTKIEMTPERIHVQGTTFEQEYGTVIEYTEKYVIVELYHGEESKFPVGLGFRRSFSKKTGKAHGCDLKILP